MSIVPRRAAVRPRVFPTHSWVGDPILLEELVAERLAGQGRGHVRLAGGPDSGRSTALCHLAHVFEGRDELQLGEEPPTPAELVRAVDALWIHVGANDDEDAGPEETWRLAAWTTDDFIEYLLAKHPAECAGVVRRLGETPAWIELSGNARVWSCLLDRLVAEPQLTGVAEAVGRELDELVSAEDWSEFEQRAIALFGHVTRWRAKLGEVMHGIRGARLAAFARQPGVVLITGARAIARGIAATRVQTLPVIEIGDTTELEALAWALPASQEIDASLERGACEPESQKAAFALSLLHRRSPERSARVAFDRSQVGVDMPDWSGARLAGLDMSKQSMRRLKLPGADLAYARCEVTSMQGCDLRGASLVGADCSEGSWVGVTAAETDLSLLDGAGLVIEHSSLNDARITSASMSRTEWKLVTARRVDLSRACLSDAKWWRVALDESKFDSTDLSGIEAIECEFGHVDLRTTKLDGARFYACQLARSRFDGVVAPRIVFDRSDLRGAHLTGSVFPGASMQGTLLRQAGLAGVSWERADLRFAQFAHSSFHFGGSRSGLVHDAPAMWGSKTGFYTIDWERDSRRPPEEIRVANLRGADLRGAQVLRCDFHLVDLRGAIYDPHQRAYFERCGAFLDPQ